MILKSIFNVKGYFVFFWLTSLNVENKARACQIWNEGYKLHLECKASKQIVNISKSFQWKVLWTGTHNFKTGYKPSFLP
jgi:hypothetical protein